MKTKFHIALATIACGFVLSTPASADPSDGEPLTKIVSYADLNLNGAAGARVLHGRLRMAAKQVCAPFSGNTLRDKSNWRDCFYPAIARSVAEIDEPTLTAYHHSQTGTTELPSLVSTNR